MSAAQDNSPAPDETSDTEVAALEAEPAVLVRHYQVEGRVQGVGFRWYVQREAAELQLRGWVRNTDAGHVEAVAAGSPEQIAELEAALRRGSRGSRVDRVRVHDLTDDEGAKLQEFLIEGAF